ncbi:phosphopantetheine-binding protein, partial [Methylocucumis oryzae]
LNAETLRAALSQQLPDYAVPSAFVILPVLPKLASGKLNKQALPEPEQRLKTHTAPSTELEIQLATIWQDVLGVADIGIDDNFFALGGHSLLAMRLAMKIRQQFSVDLPVSDIFNHPSIAAMAAALNPLIAKTKPIDLADELAQALSTLQSLSTQDLQQLLAKNSF